MQITKEFLETEIRELEAEAQKAQTFLTQAQATIQAYKMLINRLETPEPEQQDGN
jgi:prefoldin subunit 5